MHLPRKIEGSGLSKAIKTLRLFKVFSIFFILVFEGSVLNYCFEVGFFNEAEIIKTFFLVVYICITC